jgi:hypothetical protein
MADFTFNILGQNPDTTTVENALNAVTVNGKPVWWARSVAIHETAESQFWRPVVDDSTDGCAKNYPGSAASTNNTPAQVGMPTYGYPGGYGMMAVDPPLTDQGIWNWQQNILDWQSNTQASAGLEIDTSDPLGQRPT